VSSLLRLIRRLQPLSSDLESKVDFLVKLLLALVRYRVSQLELCKVLRFSSGVTLIHFFLITLFASRHVESLPVVQADDCVTHSLGE
jgi:hypothetical protein